MDDLKRLVEEPQHLVLPLNGQGRGDQDEAALDGLPQLQLLDQQTGHDRLAGAGIVREQEAQPRLRQHLQVDRLDLVRQRADAGQTDRELPVVGVGEADAGGLHEESQPVRIRGPGRFLLSRRFRPEDVYRQGISALEPQDFRYAREFGYSIRSLAIADRDDGGVQLRVYPALVPEENMLANVNGVYNAAEVDGDLCGRVLFHGMGAGRGPTTSAVLGDLIETARMVRDDAVPGGLRELSQELAVRPIDELQTRYYIRLEVADRAGVLAQIAKALGDCDISIASVLQKDAHAETQSAEIVIMTHPARESSVQQALLEISRLSPVRRVGNMIRIEE